MAGDPAEKGSAAEQGESTMTVWENGQPARTTASRSLLSGKSTSPAASTADGATTHESLLITMQIRGLCENM